MTDPHQGGYPPQAHPGYPPPHQQGYPAYPPAGYAGYPPQAAPQWPAQYEFSEVENKTIERCAAWCKALAVLFFVQAGLQVINLNVIILGVDIVIGLMFWRASKSLSAVVETEGNDVRHLMDALKSISFAFLIRLIVVAVAVGLSLLLGLIVGAVFLAAG
jgi:hypothetical protein